MNSTDLVNELDQLSAWRKKELTQARSLAEDTHNEEVERYLCRVWVLVIYAHCDNFLKEIVRIYLRYLKLNVKNINNYKYELMWLIFCGKENITNAASNNYKSLSEYSDSNKEAYLEDKIVNQVVDKGSFCYKSLRYFCDWIMQIKYNHNEFEGFCKTLKEKRDKIAHGEEFYVEGLTDCLTWHEKTIEFIDSLKESLIEAVCD